MNCKHCGLEIIVDNNKWSENHKGYKHYNGYNKCYNAVRGDKKLIDRFAWAEPCDKEQRIIKLLNKIDNI